MVLCSRVLRLSVALLFMASGVALGVPPAPALADQTNVTALIARAESFGHVESAEVVATSGYQAQQLLGASVSPGSIGGLAVAEPTAPVDIIVMHGQFVDTLGKGPRGASPPSGPVMAYIVDQATGQVGATYVGRTSPALSALGPVERWTPSTGRAVASRRHPRTFRPRRHRTHARIARWGSEGCGYPDAYHCYAIATWAMPGAEEVEGDQTNQDTTNMNVPESEHGDFVDNEVWVGFSGERWIEIGQMAGEYKGCCTLWWFYAWQKEHEYYMAFTGSPYTWEVPANVYNNYELKAIGNGDWCVDVGPNFEKRMSCWGGFETYSKRLEDGLEVATEKKPINAGSANTSAQWTTGVYKLWNTASNLAEPGLCVKDWATPSKGDIDYGTC